VSTTKTWHVAAALRIGIGILAAFLFAIASIMIVSQLVYDGGDRGGIALVGGAALVVACIGVIAAFAFAAVLRTHVTLTAAALEATVVEGHSWFLLPRFRAIRLPLSEIRSIERRTEIVRTLGLNTQRDALSLVTIGGERIGLFSNTLGSADTLPLDEVAGAIAAAAGLTVTDDGTVRARGWGSGLYGAASSAWNETPLDLAAAARARRTVVLTVQIGSALLVLTFLLRVIFLS